MNTGRSFVVGLANLGNTCFLNSCIQVLQHIYELHDIVDAASVKECPDTIVVKEWNEMRKLMQTQNGTLSPNRFVNTIHQIAKHKGRELFTGWVQNDIAEFLLFLIECIHNSMSCELNIKINGKPENELDKRAITCYTLIQDIYSKEYSKILDTFYGVYMTEIVHPDTKELLSCKPEHYFVLDLQIYNEGRICNNLYDSFDLFVRPELMMGDNAWFNDKTSQKQDAYRQVNFWNLPNILVITLKRFSPDGTQKLQSLVDFPLENLDLSKYVVGYQSASYVYDLFGVCNHMGGVMGGHYTAFVKKESGQWIHYNDHMVNPMDARAVVSPTAYCLFYRKKIPCRNI